jgi:hypothetical protein
LTVAVEIPGRRDLAARPAGTLGVGAAQRVPEVLPEFAMRLPGLGGQELHESAMMRADIGIWRPSTAIQLADTDGNPATTADPTWTPLLVNPPYPDYVSGYNAVAASATRALEDLFGRRHLDLTLISTAVPGATRHYNSGRALRRDVVAARVWLGIHFRFADVAARNLGVGLADWTLHHYFQPVKQHD